MFLSLLQNRRSIRKYKNKAIDTETIDLLVEAMLRAPTSMGKNSWQFVVVTESDKLEKENGDKRRKKKRSSKLEIIIKQKRKEEKTKEEKNRARK